VRVPLRPRDLLALGLAGVFSLAATGTHVVGRGETLSTIAADHDSTVQALVEANGIANPNLILAGETLTIPGADRPTTAYTVRAGDTLAGIAARHGTTVSALAGANGISVPNLVVVGSTLNIPGNATDSTPDTTTTSGRSGAKQLPGQRHTVRAGETIAGIAARYGIAAADLITWNGLVDGKLYATARLVLYNPGSLPTVGGGAGTHTVAVGETLSEIASRYGVSSSTLASRNRISDPRRLQAGAKLTIPGSSRGGAASFACPVPGGRYMNDWGFPRSGGRSHAGTDVFASRGTPVRAPASGIVDIATGKIGGKQFRLTTASGLRFYGSHMDAFGATGQVSAGTVIGYIGDSGNAKGARRRLTRSARLHGRSRPTARRGRRAPKVPNGHRTRARPRMSPRNAPPVGAIGGG